MKQTMKKRITALLLVFSLAALLSLSAFAEDASTTADPSVGAEASEATGSEAGSAGTTAQGGVTITGEVYYGTDYVQFDIHGGNANNLFYDVLYGEETVYQHVYHPGWQWGQFGRDRPGGAGGWLQQCDPVLNPSVYGTCGERYE